MRGSETAQLVYPSIKEESGIKKIESPRINILGRPNSKEVIYFDPKWRIAKNVISSVAKQYEGGSVDAYPHSHKSEDARYLLGYDACAEGLARPLCPYLTKVKEQLKKNKIAISNVLAVHLLGIDKGDEVNEQEFILLCRDGVYVRHETNAVDKYDYAAITFTEDGLSQRNDREETIVDYYLAEDFYRFAQDYQLLQSTLTLSAEHVHPMEGMGFEKEKEYLHFLTDLVAGEGSIQAGQLLRLELLAREFKIAASEVEYWVTTACSDKVKDSTIMNKFLDLNKDICSDHMELKYVFYQDILELIVTPDGKQRKKLWDRLKKEFAGGEFVEKYSEYVSKQKESLLALRESLLTGLSATNGEKKELYNRLTYGTVVNLTLMQWEVNANG